MYQQLL